MTKRRAAAKAEAAVMINIDDRLAPFFAPLPVENVDLRVDSSRPTATPAHQGRTQLRHRST